MKSVLFKIVLTLLFSLLAAAPGQSAEQKKDCPAGDQSCCEPEAPKAPAQKETNKSGEKKASETKEIAETSK